LWAEEYHAGNRPADGNPPCEHRGKERYGDGLWQCAHCGVKLLNYNPNHKEKEVDFLSKEEVDD
jgi:ribosomal protein L37AE/L43A